MAVRADWPFAPLCPHDDTSSDAQTPQEHSWIKGTDIGAYGVESMLERLVCGRNVHGANSANLPQIFHQGSMIHCEDGVIVSLQSSCPPHSSLTPDI